MTFKKKSQLEIQFNWIFVLITGIVFLSFFFMLIFSQTSSNELRVSASLTKHFRTIIDSTAQKSGTLNEYNFPSSFEISFDCDYQRNIYEYRLNQLKVDDVKYDVIFAPRNMETQNIYTWTREWELPENEGMSIATFLYVTSERHGYVFINDSSTHFNNLMLQFPKNISVDISNGTDNFAYRNYDAYTYIVFNDSKGKINFEHINNINKKVVYIVIDVKENNVFDWGDIYYCKTKDDVSNYLIECKNTTYFGSASLYGAIFSSDKDYYDCMMSKAFRKLNLVTLLQKYRIMNFNASISESPTLDLLNCKTNLGLGGLKGPFQKLENLNENLETPFYQDDFNLSGIREDINYLQSRNRLLSLDSRCIKLY